MRTIIAHEDGSERDVADEEELNEILPRVLPASWSLAEKQFQFQRWYRTRSGLVVCCSAAKYQDGRRWLHVSLSRRGRLPDWEDVKLVKDVVIGQERTALQVLPPKSKYVNQHPFCLHLWYCLDGDVVPDFSLAGQI